MKLCRPATGQDIDAVYAIYMHEEVIPYLGFDPMSKEAFQPVFDALLASSGFFVAEVDGVVSGFYRASRYEGRAAHVAYLGTLAIAPAHKGSGLALRMVNGAIEDLAAKGVLRVELMLEADNPRALAFYRKLGFVHEGTMRAAYKRAHEPNYIDELFLGKLLAPLV